MEGDGDGEAIPFHQLTYPLGRDHMVRTWNLATPRCHQIPLYSFEGLSLDSPETGGPVTPDIVDLNHWNIV